MTNNPTINQLSSPRSVTGYRLTVQRGARAGLRREYGPSARKAAQRLADQINREYGAHCADVSPIFNDER